MSYMDDELIRVEKYIAGLGITLKKSTNNDEIAEWSPHSITVNVNIHKTTTDLILTLLHELGHHLHYMHNGKPEIPDEVLLEPEETTKAQRKKIYEYEKPGIELMPTIAIELGLKIPMWKVYMQSTIDLWAYEYFCEEGDYPSQNQKNIKKKELTKIYKGKKYE